MESHPPTSPPPPRPEHISPTETYRPLLPGILLLRLIRALPVPLLGHVGRAVGYLWYVLHRRWRAIARTNIDLCFPEMDAASRKRLVRSHFAALGQALVVTLGLTGFHPHRRLSKWVSVKGREHFEAALATGRGIILLAPHFVGLEIGWARLASEYSMAAMYRPPRRHLLHWAVHERRSQFGSTLISSEEPLRKLVRLLCNGTSFYYLPDLDEGKHVQHVFAPFFGLPAATISALPRLARMTDSITLPCVTRQLAPGRGYDVCFLPPLENYPTDDPVADAARANRLIEDEVRKMPEQYFWVHRRFKTRPDGARSPYRRRTGAHRGNHTASSEN